ncbi:hypothetical protein BpHYR1_021633 [Brachionus plicatilis]|uniref:Ubiquitin-like domain-containing protein n=1 Tax=Brachionus plicatilis TaxID=10195 RepID=A0A3M7RUM6_BRAPC|nr:hypothetical protein BpHYR1_021633 [Brachionus plicatilis]
MKKTCYKIFVFLQSAQHRGIILLMAISILRISDGSTFQIDYDPNTKVGEIKTRVKAEFAPQFENGCRLIFNGKVLKSRKKIKRYGINDGDIIQMDDSKNWSSDSSSSSSGTD